MHHLQNINGVVHKFSIQAKVGNTECKLRDNISVGQINFFWTNEYPNIFVTIDIRRMNNQIYFGRLKRSRMNIRINLQ